MKIGIFGGTFDPWTPAHQAIVDSVLAEQKVDKVIIVPTVVNYYRSSDDEWLTYKQRCEVISHIIAKKSKYLSRIFLDTSEIDMYNKIIPELKGIYQKSRRFLHTLVSLKNRYPLDDMYLILGTDQMEKFKTWFEYESILSMTKIICVQGRDGHILYSHYFSDTVTLETKYRMCSATELRRWYKSQNRSHTYYIEHFGEKLLAKTPIFDLVEKSDLSGKIGFNPVGVNSPDWVSVIVELSGNFLLVKQLRYGLMSDCTEFPCGMVEADELPIDAALRELKEETGIEITDKTKVFSLGSCAANPAFMNNHMHYFYANLDTFKDWKSGRQHPDEHEKLDLIWLNKSNVLLNVMSDPDISVFMTGAMFKLKTNSLI